MISKYNCKQCDFKTSGRGSLWYHNKTVHEVVEFPCHQCDFKATMKYNLNSHINPFTPVVPTGTTIFSIFYNL